MRTATSADTIRRTASGNVTVSRFTQDRIVEVLRRDRLESWQIRERFGRGAESSLSRLVRRGRIGWDARSGFYYAR